MSDRMLTNVLKPFASLMNEDVARKILAVKANRKAQARVAKLAQKCSDGELTPEERREYESFVVANRIVTLFRAEALATLAGKRRGK